MMTKPKLLEDPTEQKVRGLIAAWKADHGVSSSLSQMFAHPAYKQLIEMGETAVPHLLAELEREPDWWFAALKVITGVDPVPAASRGKLAEMTRAWLDWGRAHGVRR